MPTVLDQDAHEILHLNDGNTWDCFSLFVATIDLPISTVEVNRVKIDHI